MANSLEIIVVSLKYDEIKSDYERPSNWTILFESAKILSPMVELHDCDQQAIIDCVSIFPNALVLLDLSFDTSTQQSLSKFSSENDLIHLVFQNYKYSSKWTYSIAPSKEEEIASFFSLLNYFNWTEGIVFANTAHSNLGSQVSKFSSKLNFMTLESETNIDDIVNKIVFRLGESLYYILTGFEKSVDLQNSLKSKKLLDTGSGIIFDQESGYSCNSDGSLIITEFGHEFDTFLEESLTKSVLKVLSYILDNMSSESIEEIASLFNFYMLNSSTRRQFSIVNIKNGSRVIVGSIVNKNVSIYESIVFPGQTNNIPKSSKKVLQLSINSGTSNPGGAPPLNIQKIGSLGAHAAISMISEGNDILPNFEIKLFNFDCGVIIYDAEFGKKCFTKDINDIGITHFTGFASAIAAGTLETFKELNITIPTIGSTNASPVLTSSDTYPMYARIISPSIYIQYTMLLFSMGWKKASIIYENSDWSIGIYNIIVQTAKTVAIEIANKESLREISPRLNSTSIRNYHDSFKEVIDSQTRLLILLMQCPSCNSAIEYLYDLGMRKGDLVIFAGTPDMQGCLLTNDTNLYKRKDLALASVTVLNQIWAGNIGKDAFRRILSIFDTSPTDISCNYFDSLYLVASGLDYTINRGQNYNDPHILMKAIRSMQFNGCTGRVSIDRDSNDRIFDIYVVQAIKASSTGDPIIFMAGELKPFGSHLLLINDPIVYSDGTTIKPSDLRNANDKCPFPTKNIRTFTEGRAVLFAICFSVGIITIIITFIIWKNWWNISIEELKERKEISLQDTIAGLTIAIEFFQFVAMGPDTSLISTFLFDISNALSLSLGSILKLENGVFWVVVDFVYGGIALWIFLCIVVLFRLDEKLESISFFRLIGVLADYLMPILGNLCFIPFISICLDIFECDQSIGNNFTDSFLAKDCYYFCWKDEHLVYAILSFFTLLAYEPLAVFCRPLWQELQVMLHVKVKPLFLMVKTVVQIILIVLNKTVKRSSDIAHGAVFIITMIIYIAFIFKLKPYNYARFSWWQGISLIGVAWLALLSMIGLIINNSYASTPLLVILILGWIALASYGVYVQRKKYPSLLYRAKARDTNTLFKFAFTFGKESKKTLDLMKMSDKASKVKPI